MLAFAKMLLGSGTPVLSDRWSDRASTLRGGTFEIPVPGDERGVCAERERARKVDGVVSAESELLGKLARLPC
jgi:hypothetical protein